jgi:hypothetical protein
LPGFVWTAQSWPLQAWPALPLPALPCGVAGAFNCPGCPGWLGFQGERFCRLLAVLFASLACQIWQSHQIWKGILSTEKAPCGLEMPPGRGLLAGMAADRQA